MSKPTQKQPAYRKQSGRNQAVVTLTDTDTGRRRPYYLGPYDSRESWERYHALLAWWEANGRRLPDDPRQAKHRPSEGPSVSRIILEYWRHAESYYVKPDGTPTTTLGEVKVAVGTLRATYGTSAASDFGPKKLREVRGAMLQKGWSRSTINARIDHIRRMFKWAASYELVPPHVPQALSMVAGLRKGEYGVPEGRDVKPVPEAHIDKIKPYVADQVWALIRLQLHTAARPGELVLMRPMDIDRSGTVWTYTPESHKGEHHGHGRTVYIGPKAQQIITPYLDRAPHAYLFSPAEADEARRQARREARKTPESCGNRPGTNRRGAPRKQPGDRYTADSYRRAIAYACKRAVVPHWHPHQLRHNAGTFIRKEYGIEAARLILGHQTAGISLIYAEADEQKAKDIIAKVG